MCPAWTWLSRMMNSCQALGTRATARGSNDPSSLRSCRVIDSILLRLMKMFGNCENRCFSVGDPSWSSSLVGSRRSRIHSVTVDRSSSSAWASTHAAGVRFNSEMGFVRDLRRSEGNGEKDRNGGRKDVRNHLLFYSRRVVFCIANDAFGGRFAFAEIGDPDRVVIGNILVAELRMVRSTG